MKNKLYQKIFLILFLTVGFFALVSDARADYYAEGILQSKNILSNATVTAINSFQVTATVPANTTVSVKFSQDRVNYYSSAGVKDEWDSCANGTTNIDLSGLTWSGDVLFYKIKLTTTDELVTPVVGQVMVDYDGTAVPAVTGITYPPIGHLTSTDLLSGSGITLSGSDYFGYGISYLPYGTGVSAQFSQDGITWYDSAGTMWGWDTLSFGDHSTPATALSLSALNWRGATSFYYKLKIEIETLMDNAVTPIIAEAGLAMFSADPILDLNFDEGQGPTAYDASGNNNHGTLVSGATGTNTTPTMMWDKGGKKGGAMEFDGVDDYIYIDKNIFNGLSGYTVSMWINRNPGVVNYLFSGSSGFPHMWDFGALSGIRFKSSGADPNYITTPLADSTWYNIVVSQNGNSATWYVNGKKNKEPEASSLATYNTGVYFGSNFDASSFWGGKIDEVKIYNYALGEDEIKTLYNDSSAMVMGNDESRDNNGTEVTGANKDYCIPGDTAKCDKPVLELNLDERSGATAKDSSGNGRDGTISGAVWDRGKINSGLKFDGDGDRISVDNGSDLATSTYCAWHYYAGEDMYGLVEGADTDANFDAYISGLDDVYFWADNTDGNRTMLTGGKIVENQWNQVCFVFGTGKREIYINGAKTAGDTFTAEPIRYNFIGETNSLSYLGSIDEVRIYDYARTPAQIAWDYNRGKPISHWTFDEGTGTTAHDLGEGKNHATINGATWKNESECKNGKCLSFDGVNDFVEKDVQLVSSIKWSSKRKH